jgi:hypothetical protein
MAFLCKDCSYRGRKSGQVGECPACGSFNIEKHAVVGTAKPAPGKWRIVVLVGLWGVLLTMITWKLNP